MLSEIRPRPTLGSALIPVSLILAFFAIIPDTFAQTPNAAPLAVVVSVPTDTEVTVRPRRALAGPYAKAPSLSEATEIEKHTFDLINTARHENGVTPLTWDPELCIMARAHSADMVRRQFFSHETPDGLRMTDRAHTFGIAHFKLLGENIAFNQGFDDPGGFAVERWMRSSGHRANILNPRFQESAIGVFVASDGTVYLTQEFIAR